MDFKCIVPSNLFLGLRLWGRKEVDYSLPRYEKRSLPTEKTDYFDFFNKSIFRLFESFYVYKSLFMCIKSRLINFNFLGLGKRYDDAIPGVLRFGKRNDNGAEMPGVLRFGKRRFEESAMPGILRFGKRYDNNMAIPGLSRFGKKSGDMPGVLRFGKRSSLFETPGVLRFGRK